MKVAIERNRIGGLFGGYSFNLTIEGRKGLIRVRRVK